MFKVVACTLEVWQEFHPKDLIVPKGITHLCVTSRKEDLLLAHGTKEELTDKSKWPVY